MSDGSWPNVRGALCALLGVIVLYRFGLLAALSAYFVYHLGVFYPLTTELSAWYARDFLAGAAITIALVLYGFYVSLGEQKLIGDRTFAE